MNQIKIKKITRMLIKVLKTKKMKSQQFNKKNKKQKIKKHPFQMFKLKKKYFFFIVSFKVWLEIYGIEHFQTIIKWHKKDSWKWKLLLSYKKSTMNNFKNTPKKNLKKYFLLFININPSSLSFKSLFLNGKKHLYKQLMRKKALKNN